MEWISWVGDWVYQAIAGASATLKEWGETLYCVGISVWCWLMNFLVDSIDEWLVSPFVEAVPAPPESWDFMFLAGLYGTVNYYTPLAEAITLGSAWGVLYCTVLAYRVIKAHIPGLS